MLDAAVAHLIFSYPHFTHVTTSVRLSNSRTETAPNIYAPSDTRKVLFAFFSFKFNAIKKIPRVLELVRANRNIAFISQCVN